MFQTTKHLTAKLENICAQYGIKIRCLEPGAIDVNHANRAQKIIWVRKIVDKSDYVAGLHELGYTQCDPVEGPRSDLEKLDADCSAWKWVLDNFRVEFDAKSWKRLHSSLKQYRDHVLQLRDDHPVHALLSEAEKEVPEVNPYRFFNLLKLFRL